MATSDAPLNVPNVTLAVARGNGSGQVPAGINAAGVAGHGNSLTITDSESRLGTKDQAAPRYWIFGDEVYVDGVAKTEIASATAETTITDLPYLSQGSSAPIITEARPYRHNRVSRHFHGTSRTHLGSFLNLVNESVSAGVRNALYVSWWMRLGFNAGNGTIYQQVESISTSPAPDFGSNLNDADGEDILIGGSVVGRLMGHVIEGGTNFVTLQRYSSRSFDGETVTGASTGATIVFTTGGLFGSFGGKSLRNEPGADPQVLSIGVNTWAGAEHFVYDASGTKLYDVRSAGINIDAGDAAQDDTNFYDDRVNPFPRWGHHHYWTDFTGTYLRDRAGRDLKNLKYFSSYEALIAQSAPAIDTWDGLIPSSRASTLAPRLINLGYEPGGTTRGQGNVDFSEILVDRTPRRVVIGNASTWTQVTHVENQRTTGWIANKVDFVMNLGSFADADNFWLYIMNDLDEPIFANGIPRSEVK